MSLKRGRESPAGYAMLAGGVVFWSTIEVSSKAIAEGVSPLGVAFGRFSLSLLFLLPLLFISVKRNPGLTKTVKEHSLKLALLGLLGITGTFILYHLSLKYIPAASAAIIVSSVPIFVSIFSIILYKEIFTLLRALGVAGGFLGLLILLLSRGGLMLSPVGYTMILAATLLFSIYTVLSHPLMEKMGTTAFTSITITFGTLGFLPFFLIPGSDGSFLQNPSSSHILILLYLGLGATGGGYLLYFLGLSKVNPGAGSSLLFLKPPIASFLAVMVLGERLTLPLVASMLIISLSLYFVVFSPPEEEEESE
ncbi:MAG: EamA family transporter [Thermoplasmata archaeon]|nr:EamA family transporter [Thermoplasmata archaeon]